MQCTLGDTMNDQQKAMRFAHPEYTPASIVVLAAGWLRHGDALREVAERYPGILAAPEQSDYRELIQGGMAEGEYTDGWGCVWSNVHEGHSSIVTGHPVPARADVHKLKMPTEDMGLPHGFMYLRLADLRGFEELMIDFAEEPPELQMLIDLVLEYNVQQAPKLFACFGDNKPDPLWFGDDLGTQHALPISPAKWRKYLKPCYKKIYDTAHEAGFNVFMHTDGQIYEIISDLVECGVDVINPQIRANGFDNLARTCKGKVCVALDLDRQMFPFCTPQEIDDHVREAVETLGSPEGGLWLGAEVDDGVPLENIEALCMALEKYRGYFR